MSACIHQNVNISIIVMLRMFTSVLFIMVKAGSTNVHQEKNEINYKLVSQ